MPNTFQEMMDMLNRAVENAEKIKTWELIHDENGWMFYKGTTADLFFMIAYDAKGGDDFQADGTYTERTNPPTLLHLTPKIAKQVAQIVLKNIKSKLS